MFGYWFHQEEAETVGVLLDYCEHHRGAVFTIVYEDGEKYRCKFCTSYDSDNEEEVESGIESTPDDYVAIAVDPVEDIVAGRHHREVGTLIELSYRDFPARIVAEDGTQVYPA